MVSRSSDFWKFLAIPALLMGMSDLSWAGFTIRDLGVLIKQGTSGAEAINGSGQAAGMATGTTGLTVAVKSSGSGGFESVSVPPGATSSLACSINLGGDVAGRYTDRNGVYHGFYSSAGQSDTVGPLLAGTKLQGTWTEANGINDKGAVVGTGDIAGGANRAFSQGSGNSPTVIGPLLGGTYSQGNGINNSGAIIGTSDAADGLAHAFLVNPFGVITDLSGRNPVGAFGYNVYGMAIANNFDVAGYGDVGSYTHAFYASFKGGAMVDLGVLPGATSSYAYGLNGLSQVVGELDFGPTQIGQPDSSAFLWDAGKNKMFDLNTLISTSDQASWVLTKATGINDSDQISGEGYLNGVLHGFVLDPIPGQPIFLPPSPASVPEPPALVMSLIGLAFVATCWRFHLRRGRSVGRATA